jgi:hypothetical protein
MHLYQIIYAAGSKIFLRWLAEEDAENLKSCFENIRIRKVIGE